MALVVEDGTGLPNPESYISEEDAAAYLEKQGRLSEWPTDLDTQRAILRRAFYYMEAAYGHRFKGFRFKSTQGASFPRNGLYVDGAGTGSETEYCATTYPYPVDQIPDEIKFGQVEFAVIANVQSLNPNLERAETEVKVGPIQVKYDKGSTGRVGFAQAVSMFSGLLKSVSGGAVMRLARV